VWKRLLKFAVVGGMGTLVNEGLFVVLAKVSPLLYALIVAIEVSIIFNFVFNDIWTFKDRRVGKFLHRLLKFHLSSLTGGIVQAVVVVALVSLILRMGRADLLGLMQQIFMSSLRTLSSISLLEINLIGIVAGFVVRFLVSLTFVWRRDGEETQGQLKGPHEPSF
jgi:putative flippase GtrA